MINTYLKDEFYAYDAFHITKAFFPNEEIKQHIVPEQEELLLIRTSEEVIAGIGDAIGDLKKEKKSFVNKKIYKELSTYTGKELAWGILTGVRPTKLAMKKVEEGCTDDGIVAWFRENYMVTEKKARLGVEIAKREKSC